MVISGYWWVDLLARLHPFKFCANCVISIMDGKEQPSLNRRKFFYRWATDRCAACGRK